MTIMMALLGADTAVTLLLDFCIPANHILSSFLFSCTGSRSILQPLHQCVPSSRKKLSLPAQLNDACMNTMVGKDANNMVSSRAQAAGPPSAAVPYGTADTACIAK
jgi:hypothetical protein